NNVEICGGKFHCHCNLPSGATDKVQVDFDEVEIKDDESVGIIGATVVSSIYKGSYYQIVARTDDDYDFFIDTDDEWLKDDRIGIYIKPENIRVTEYAEADNG